MTNIWRSFFPSSAMQHEKSAMSNQSKSTMQIEQTLAPHEVMTWPPPQVRIEANNPLHLGRAQHFVQLAEIVFLVGRTDGRTDGRETHFAKVTPASSRFRPRPSLYFFSFPSLSLLASVLAQPAKKRSAVYEVRAALSATNLLPYQDKRSILPSRPLAPSLAPSILARPPPLATLTFSPTGITAVSCG